MAAETAPGHGKLGGGYEENRVDVRIHGKYIGKRFSNNANATEPDANMIWGIDAGYTFPPAENQTLSTATNRSGLPPCRHLTKN